LPDLNVWLALSWSNHRHSGAAWKWFSGQPDSNFLFCRFSQIGLMRLLATSAIMGEDVLTIGQTWATYDRWLQDSRIELKQESFPLEDAFRISTRSVAKLASPKSLGDCYLLAFSQSVGATLVTFDKALAASCRKAAQPATLLRHV
jgi:toxin-antitoxin system PIN domain toxin